MTVAVETTTAGCYIDVTPAALERLLHQATDENPYLIVTRDDREGFAQAHLAPSKRDGRRRFLVEYRDTPNAPMRPTELVIDRAVGALTGMWAASGRSSTRTSGGACARPASCTGPISAED